MVKRILATAVCVAALSAEPAADVTLVRVQIQGCLRSTCSRKVAQALHKGKIGLSSVGDLAVDSVEHGLASFKPKDGSVDLKKMSSELDRAGYGVKLVLVETPSGAKLQQLAGIPVSVTKPCSFALPTEWQTRSDKQQFVWVPSKGASSLTVCSVP